MAFVQMINFASTSMSYHRLLFGPIFRACLLAGFLVPQALIAQSLPLGSLGIKDGLPQATITAMLQDDAGFVWVGTRDGLARYDGYAFEVFRNVVGDTCSLTSNHITALCQGADGDIWVGTSFGLNRLNPRTLKAARYYHWFEDDYSLSSNRVKALATDRDGRIYIGTDNGLNLFHPGGVGFQKYYLEKDSITSLSGNRISDLVVDRHNRLWIGTDVGLSLMQEDGVFKRYRYQFDDDNSLSHNEVLCIAEGASGNLWIGTRSGLNKFHPELEVFTRYFADRPKPGLLSADMITSLLIDVDGKLWVGTPVGLNQLYQSRDGDDRMAGSYVAGDLPVNNITEMISDASGLIWMGTLTAGIFTLNTKAQRFFAEGQTKQAGAEPEQHKVYSFVRSGENELLVGTGMGLTKYRLDLSGLPGNRHWKNAGQVLATNAPVRDMWLDQSGLLWLATDGQGLLAVDPVLMQVQKAFTVDPENEHGISSNRISALLAASDTVLWVGTLGGGFCRFDRPQEKFTSYRFSGGKRESLRDNNVTSLVLDPGGHIWLGTGNAGLYQFDPDTDRLSLFDGGNAQGRSLQSASINDLYLDRNGRLWVATQGGGLAYLSRGEKEFTTYLQENGLASNVVHSLCVDFDNNLWVSTNAGISALNTRTGTFRNFNEQDVPGFNTYFAASVYQDNESRVYFGGANGFTYFYAEGLRVNAFVPPVVIRSIALLDEAENGPRDRQRLKQSGDTARLEYDHPGFTIEFASLNFEQPEKNQYAYRLLGLSEEWRYMGTRRFATFSSLPPGNYRLEVRGSNNDDLWNDTPAVLHIHIAPAFWQTVAFRVAAVAIMWALFYLIYLWRIRREQKQRKALELAVADRTKEIAKERDTNAVLLREVHHRVKNNLQIIVSLLSLQSRFIKDHSLIRVFDEVQNRVRSMSLIHQKMYQSKDLSTVNIAEYIQDLAHNLLNTYRVEQRVQLEVNVEVNRFNSDTLTPLGLIINEIISNALKYAFEEDKEGRIFVEIKGTAPGAYRMVIGDDGIGMQPQKLSEVTDSFGTELVTALTEQLNGTIKLLPVDKGTMYQIDFEETED